MSIKQRLLLSNILLIVLPITAFFIIEILLGYVFFSFWGPTVTENNIGTFTTARFVLFAVAIIIINSLLIILLSRTIIKPLNKLRTASKEIGSGNLDFSVDTTGKDELSELAREFDDMRLKLKASKELNDAYAQEKRTMVASIGHDLKTPVTSIQGYVDGLIDGVAATPEKREKYLNTISRKTRELDQLIDELSLFISLDTGEVPLQKERMELDQFLKHFVDEGKLELEAEEVELTYQNSAGKAVVEADRMKLSRVFVNILNNSVKYRNKSKHEIGIELLQSGQYATVNIADNGRGISKTALNEIFEPFFREESSRNKNTGGSGLGLSIAKSIVESHNGYIDIESIEGEWTSVTVKLPLNGVQND